MRLLPLLPVLAVLAAGAPRATPGGEDRPLGIESKPAAVEAKPRAGETRTAPTDTKPSAAANAAIQFRRVYAPQDRLEQWPRGKYLPLDADKFEDLLRQTQDAAPRDSAGTAARLVAASYSARLTDQRRLAGNATLEIAHTAKTPALMLLSPCNLALANARWSEAEAGQATLGIGGDGKLELLVERAGQLQWDWSFAGRDVGQDATFQVELPACPVNRLVLDLPSALAPLVDRGLVLDGTPLGEDLRRWQVELGGHYRFQLRLAKSEGAKPRQPLVLLRQATNYEFSPQGVETTVKLKLEVHQDALAEITLDLDVPLQLVAATVGTTPLSWSARPPAREGTARVVLALPQPAREGTHAITLRALAPLLTGQPWKLPRIRPADMVWQEGSAALVVAAPLAIQHIAPLGCRQSESAALPAPRVGQTARFECFKEDATVQVVLAESPASLTALSGTATKLGDGGMSSRVITDFHAASAPQFSLEAAVTPEWTIDSVDSLPDDAVDDWTVEGPERGWRRLRVRLARPLAPSRPLRVLISARRIYGPPARDLEIDDVVPARFPLGVAGKHLISLRAAGPRELCVAGGERLRPITASELTAAEVDLLGGIPGEFLMQEDSEARTLRIGLQHRKPTYTAAIRVEAVAAGETLQESYLIQCVPSKSARIDRVLVRFSQGRDVPPRWSSEDGEEDQPAARRCSPREPAAAGLPAGQELWELSFRRPRNELFRLRAVREAALAGHIPVSLACLPDAAEQQGWLILHELGPGALNIENRRLKMIEAEPLPAEQIQTARATCLYDPQRDLEAGAGPAVLVSTSAAHAVSKAWIWKCVLDSRYAADGSGQHLLAYRVQSSGERSLRLALPAQVSREDVVGAWIDGRRAALCWCAGQDRDMLTIDLPPGARLPMVTLHLATGGGRLRTLGRLVPPLPEVDLPVLDQHWLVRLPPGFEAARFEPGRQTASLRRPTWSQRLFGVLGRGPDEAAFNPFEPADWLPEFPLDSRNPEATTGAAQTSAATGMPAWVETAAPGMEAQDTAGWPVYRLELPNSREPLEFVHAATIRVLGWLVFLVVVAAGWWKCANRALLLVVAVGILAVAGLLAPPACVPLISSALLGVLFCLAFQWVHRMRTSRRAANQRVRPVEVPSTVTGVLPLKLLLLAAVLLPSASLAAEGTDSVYQVIVPVDERQQPAGGKYYLPEAFYDHLHRRAAARGEKPQGWLLVGADYQGTLVKDAATQRSSIEQFRAEFEVRVFDAGARIRLPLSDRGAKMLRATVALDGHAIQGGWEADGSALLVDIAEPGEHRLELSLQPAVQSGNGMAGFELSVPRLPSARLELTMTGGAPVVEVPTAAGGVRREQEPPRIIADLGPADRLAVRWPDAAAREERLAALDVEQLLWLKIQPGAVVVDARLKLKVVGGQLRRLQLAADAGLQLLPLTGPDAPAVEVRKSLGQRQIIELQWSSPVTRETTVDARFLATGVSGIGNLRLPHLEVLEARPTKRWLAVSIDPSLDYQVQAPRQLDSMAVPAFIAAWGDGESAPALAYYLPLGQVDWNLSTTPRRPDTAAEPRLTLIFDRAAADVRFDCPLVTAAGSVFQHCLSAPPELQIERIAVSCEGTERLAWWTRDAKGTITVFLNGPVSGRHDLSLRASLPLVPEQEMRLPLLALEATRAQPISVQVFRRPAVRVVLDGVSSRANDEDAGGDPARIEGARLVRSFSVDPAALAPAALRVLPNRSVMHARQTTQVFWEDGAWKASVTCRLTKGFWDSLIDDGAVVDEIWLDAPASWNVLDKPSRQLDIQSLDRADGGKRWVLRPASPIARDYEMTVTGRLDLPPSDRIVAPEIFLRSFDRCERFLVLPRQVQDQPIAWQTQGLSETHLPDAPANTAVYEVVGDTSLAVLQLLASASHEGRIRLADFRMAWRNDGSIQGTAAFEVEAGRLKQCPLWLPPGYQLIHVAVAGSPVNPLPAAEGGWWLPLVAVSPLQRVEVVFSAENVQRANGAFSFFGPFRRDFLAPRLGGLAVQQTSWTIAGPPSAGPAVLASEGANASSSNSSSVEAEPTQASSELSARWRQVLGGSAAVDRFEFQGACDSLALLYSTRESTGLRSRLTSAIVCASLAVAAVVLMRRGAIQRGFARWPSAFGIALGLGWWLWLWPSIVGLALVLVMVLGLLAPWIRGTTT